jgi:hypothetical protein
MFNFCCWLCKCEKKSRFRIWDFIRRNAIKPIAENLSQGIASVPCYISPSLQDISRGLINADAKVTLGGTFRRMKLASEYFQRIIFRRGISYANNYILTSIDTANSQVYTLFTIVYRTIGKINVLNKYDGHTIQTFENIYRLYFEPFQKDVSGNDLDVIIDWAGLPHDLMLTQNDQALMLTMAANSVVNEKRSSDY